MVLFNVVLGLGHSCRLGFRTSPRTTATRTWPRAAPLPADAGGRADRGGGVPWLGASQEETFKKRFLSHYSLSRIWKFSNTQWKRCAATTQAGSACRPWRPDHAASLPPRAAPSGALSEWHHVCEFSNLPCTSWGGLPLSPTLISFSRQATISPRVSDLLEFYKSLPNSILCK